MCEFTINIYILKYYLRKPHVFNLIQLLSVQNGGGGGGGGLLTCPYIQ